MSATILSASPLLDDEDSTITRTASDEVRSRPADTDRTPSQKTTRPTKASMATVLADIALTCCRRIRFRLLVSLLMQIFNYPFTAIYD
eukprot:scaffold127389_cov29-Prasinocladus_malaysianus.AAC.1